MLAVIELVLQKSKLLRGNHFHPHPIFKLPLTFQAQHSLINVCSHIGMDVKREMLDANLVDQIVNLSLQLVGEQDAGLDFARSIASGASLLHIHVHRRSYPLPGDLH